jgi:hypothetical protein
MERKPSEKQLDFIEAIEKELNTIFDGDTFEDAKEWIAEHITEFKHSKSDLKDEYDYWKNDAE